MAPIVLWDVTLGWAFESQPGCEGRWGLGVLKFRLDFGFGDSKQLRDKSSLRLR